MTIKNVTEEEKKKGSLIGFLSAYKINNYNAGAGRNKKRGKKSESIYRTSQKKRIVNVFLVTAVRVLSLTGSHSPPHLSGMPSSTVLISGPAVGAAQTLTWSYPCVSLPPRPTAVRASAFPLRALSASSYTLHRRSVCWLILWVYSAACTAGGTLWVLFLSCSAPGFQLCIISTSACGPSSGVCT